MSDDFNLPQWLQLLLPHASKFRMLDINEGLVMYTFRQEVFDYDLPPRLRADYPEALLRIVLSPDGYCMYLYDDCSDEAFYPRKFESETICPIPDWPGFCTELKHLFDGAIAHWDQLEKDDILGEQPGMDDPCSVS